MGRGTTVISWYFGLINFTFSHSCEKRSLKLLLFCMFRRVLPRRYGVVSSYSVEGREVRILNAGGVLIYDVVVPELNPLERFALNAMLAGEEVSLEELGGVDSGKVREFLRLQRSLGELEYLIADNNLTDIYIFQNGVVGVVHLKYGELDTTFRLAEPERFASRLRMLTNKQFDHSSPLLSHFHRRFRISAAGYSATPSQQIDVAIRLWHEFPLSLLDLMRFGSLNAEIASLLTILANLGCAIIIVGDRSSGKSTLLQALLLVIPRRMRKVCILTEREIHEYFYAKDYRISDFKVHLGDEVSAEGVPLEQAVKQMLIHGRSGYIVYNEIKFRREAELFFTTCAIAGYSSILTTMHADSPEKLLHRLAFDFNLPPEALRSIDFILLTQVVRRGFSLREQRMVTRLTEIREFRRNPLEEDAIHDLFRYNIEKGTWEFPVSRSESETKWHGESEVLREKLRARGLSERDFRELHSTLTEAYREMAREYRSTEACVEKYVEFINKMFSELPPGNEDGGGS